jgi:hypothetical protein
MKFEKLGLSDKIFNFLRFLPIEKCRVHLFTKQGEIIHSKLLFGKRNTVGSLDKFEAIFSKLRYITMKKKLNVDYIEIVHNHKTHKLADNTKRIGEFSQADIFIANSLQRKFDIPLKMSIFTDQGFKFTKFF